MQLLPLLPCDCVLAVVAGSPLQGAVEDDETSKSSDGADSEKSSSSSIPGSDLPVYPR